MYSWNFQNCFVFTFQVIIGILLSAAESFSEKKEILCKTQMLKKEKDPIAVRAILNEMEVCTLGCIYFENSWNSILFLSEKRTLT